MELQIDAGNTRLKWRLRDNGETFVDGAVTDVLDMVQPLDGERVDRIIVSSVRGDQSNADLARLLQNQFGSSPVFHSTKSVQCGLTCAYENPANMGADRWHALIGAWTGHQGALIVVDAGSAITIDYVTTEGLHEGGFILAGESMQRKAMLGNTDRVRYQGLASAHPRPGADTRACVENGFAWFWEALVARIEQDGSQRPDAAIVVTGGDASRLIDAGLRATFRPELVLDGLEQADRCES